MEAIRRAARTVKLFRGMYPSRTPSHPYPLFLCSRLQLLPSSQKLSNETFEQQRIDGQEASRQKFSGKLPAQAALAALFGFGVLDIAFNDDPPTSESAQAPSPNKLQDIARVEKARLEELLRKNGARYGFYPRFSVAVKGQKVSFSFQVPPSCEIPLLISKLVSRLGVNTSDNGAGSDMMLRVWDSGVSLQLALSRPKTNGTINGDQGQRADTDTIDGDFSILIFRPLITSGKAEIEFMKQGSFTSEELEALAYILQFAGQQNSLEFRPRGDTAKTSPMEKAIASLEGMGVKIYGLQQQNGELSGSEITWDNIAGYDFQKREIEDTILLALKNPEVYDDIARGTRCKFETNRPRAVLFEGPPGTGKTSCARVIANQTGVPLLYVPLEILMSKYYGESERLLGKVFSLANDIPNGAIVFLDEIDSVATARENEMHEATRRVLSVLLRQIDGFEQDKRVVVIAATNRKQDLDPALNSRFDSTITFGLPDQQTREAIVGQYAKHLTRSEMSGIAALAEGMSGRDIRDFCQQAERHWASKIIRGQVSKSGDDDGGGSSLLPPLNEYTESVLQRKTTMISASRNPDPFSKKSRFEFL
ncbi:hypothetical protein M569_04996 [Genlisea aurea]|uniref:AAA+ ATPase domain-containing protein n=1 Tax=Genlisea aurea TaxID=192259 RepID=S8E253_9LAMI|nr:hypothetical protein M569_04996 [Genlisea aurea]